MGEFGARNLSHVETTIDDN